MFSEKGGHITVLQLKLAVCDPFLKIPSTTGRNAD